MTCRSRWWPWRSRSAARTSVSTLRSVTPAVSCCSRLGSDGAARAAGSITGLARQVEAKEKTQQDTRAKMLATKNREHKQIQEQRIVIDGKTYFLRSAKLPARICDSNAFCGAPSLCVSFAPPPLGALGAAAVLSCTPPAIALKRPALPPVAGGAARTGTVGGAAGGRAGDTAAAAPETSLPLLEPSLPPMPAEAKKSSTSASATLSDAILCRTAPSGSPALSIDRYFRNAGRR